LTLLHTRLRPLLERHYRDFDAPAHLVRDPLGFLHRYARRDDVEVVGFVAASLAFGRVRSFAHVLDVVFDALGEHPADALRSGDVAVFEAATRVGYRWLQPADLKALLGALSIALTKHGSLEALFAADDDGGEDTWTALGAMLTKLRGWATERHEAPEERSRALAFLFPSTDAAAACKRQHLFLRWMVRPDVEGADRGLWTQVDRRRLVMPCDVHTARIGHALGLADRSDPSRSTADQLTRNLRLIDPTDPVRYDFALAHLGISRGCKGRMLESICGSCSLRSACRWWGKV
jgi:uncharacterized protein (TIGR02757 family)